MKFKHLLIAITLIANLVATASTDGIYNVTDYQANRIGSTQTFAGGTSMTSHDDDAPIWQVVITQVDQDNYLIHNLVNRGETIHAIHSPQRNTLTIPAGEVIYVENGRYIHRLCGGFRGPDAEGGNSICDADSIMTLCDENWSLIETSWAPVEDVVLRLDGDNITAHTPILIYIDVNPAMIIGYADTIYTVLSLRRTGDYEPTLPGDTDGDGQLSVADVVIMCNIVLEGRYEPIADIDRDGSVSVADVVMLVNTVLEVSD